MIQNLLTYLLIASAAAYILFSLYRMIFPSKNGKARGCPGCSGGCEKKYNTPPENNNVPTGLKSVATVGPVATVLTERNPGFKTLQARSYSSDSGSAPAAGANTMWVPQDFASSDLANRLQ